MGLSEILILCPYCLSPIQDQTIQGPVCLQDTTCDAKYEMTRAEFDAEPRKPCWNTWCQFI